MKVIVKQGYTAFYGRMMRYAGDIVDIKEEECPKWANVYEEETPSTDNIQASEIVAPTHTVQENINVTEQTEPSAIVQNEEETPSTDNIQASEIVAPTHTVQENINVTEQTEPSAIVQNEEEAPSTDNIQSSEPANNELFEKLSQLIDEAVNLGIVYEPDENTSIQTQIDELLELINKKKA